MQAGRTGARRPGWPFVPSWHDKVGVGRSYRRCGRAAAALCRVLASRSYCMCETRKLTSKACPIVTTFRLSLAGATDWGQEAREAAGASPGTSKWQVAGV
jgi:hypothetical protein